MQNGSRGRSLSPRAQDSARFSCSLPPTCGLPKAGTLLHPACPVRAYLFDDGKTGRPVPLGARLLYFCLAMGLLVAIFYFCARVSGYQWDWSAVLPYWRKFVTGWLVTVQISAAALVLSTAIGLAFALARRSRILPIRYFSRLYVELIRGTPLLVQLMISFYIVANGFGVQNRYVVGVIALALFSGAYISEIIRAGIESVGATQLESARAIGLTSAQTYRHVVFPQAIRQIMPPLAGQFALLIKDSSLLSVLGINEFMLSGQEVSSFTYAVFESYIPLAVGYLIITLPISLWIQSMEHRHRFET
jgi:polar amino acid transport system permease protein